MYFLFLCVVTFGGLTWYVMNPAERKRALQTALVRIGQARALLNRIRPEREPLEDVLRQRTRFALVTPALVAVNLGVFIGLMFDGGGADPEALVRWGASYGPLTTNGEWWRILTSTVVHGGVLHLVVNLAALVSVGFVLERLVGHFTFLAVYVAAAAFGGVVGLASSSVAVVAGGGAAIFGLYGLLLATWTWGVLQHATTTIRLRSIMRLAPPALIFVLYHSGDIAGANLAAQTGLVTGLVCGLALTRCVRVCTPPARRIATTTAVTVALAAIAAVPLRGVIDVRPEVRQAVALEARLSEKYQAAVEGFTKGRVTRKALIDMIEQNILPEFQEPRNRLKTLGRVPPEHRQMVVAIETYLRLRDEGWRVRASALKQGSALKLREADRIEQASLAALRTIDRRY